MTHSNLLCELLDRIAALKGKAALISTEDLNQWPVDEVTALKKHKLLRKTRPASSVVCTECEEECVRPVYSDPEPGGENRVFLVCEQQSDVNRIEIPTNRLEQWQTSGDLFANFTGELLGLRKPSTNQVTTDRWEVGLLKGKKYSSHIVLLASDTLNLTLAGHSIALADTLTLEGDQLAIDKKILTRFVDNPVTGGGDVESAEQRRVRVKKRVQELKTQGVKAFLKTVAEEEGISTTRVKQLINDDEPATKQSKNFW